MDRETFNPDLAAKRERLEELRPRYEALLEFAKKQTFVVVFRAEGQLDWTGKSQGNQDLTGTWYAERFDEALKYKDNIQENGGGEVKIYSLVVPQSLLDGRDHIDKGMIQVNVLNAELRAGRKEISSPDQASEPDLENYLNQFAFVREYRQLEKELG